jgi:hypothetical protein
MEEPHDESCDPALERVARLLCAFPLAAAAAQKRLSERIGRAPWVIRPFTSAYESCQLLVAGLRSDAVVRDDDDEARRLYQAATGPTAGEASLALEPVSRRLTQLAVAGVGPDQLSAISSALVRWAAAGHQTQPWMEPAEGAYEALRLAADARPRRGRRYYATCEALRQDYRRAWEQALRPDGENPTE